MLKKLRRQFICFTMIIVTVLLSLVFSLTYHATKQNLEQQSLQVMERIKRNAFRPDFHNGQDNEIQLPYFVLYIYPDGEIRTHSSGYFDLTDTAYIEDLRQTVMNAEAQVGVLSDCNLRYFRDTAPFGTSIIFIDTSSEQAVLGNLVANSLLIGAVCLLALLGIAQLLARCATKPVEDAWNQQKQFVADASHELKTPLTVILTNAELLQTPQLSEDSRGQFADNILAMSHQMRGLVEGLLELARVDNGTLKTHFAQLDLSQLVQDTILPFEPLYFEEGLELRLYIEDQVVLTGSESHLRQVLEILLDNARKYAYPKAVVEVRLERQGNHCLLSVTNPGDPISKADLENIFKRFYRVNKARSMNHSYGLGLPIARGIVTEHRGKIWAESAGGKNIFRVQLPCGTIWRGLLGADDSTGTD